MPIILRKDYYNNNEDWANAHGMGLRRPSYHMEYTMKVQPLKVVAAGTGVDPVSSGSKPDIIPLYEPAIFSIASSV